MSSEMMIRLGVFCLRSFAALGCCLAEDWKISTFGLVVFATAEIRDAIDRTRT